MNRFYGVLLTKILVLGLATGCGLTRFGSKSSKSPVTTDSTEAINGEIVTTDSDVNEENNDTANNGGTDGGMNDGMDDGMNNGPTLDPEPTIQEIELENLGIGIKSAQQVFETMVNITGIPADQADVAAGYDAYFASLTPEDRSRNLKLSPGQVTALTNLVLPFCRLAATDDAVRTRMYGARVDFNQTPGALSPTERIDLSMVWAERLWADGRLGTLPANQQAVLSAFADKVITDVDNQAAAGTPLVATTVCVGTVIAFQSIEF
ncbi:MAG: hypothetical protein AB8G05_17020 [Oligoflexales bacterium]